MLTEVEAYELLGVPRRADLTEVKLAFRRAALKWHPDSCPDDPAGAVQTFREVVEAYRIVSWACIRPAGEDAPPRATRRYTPQDFTRFEVGWHCGTPIEHEDAAQAQWGDRRFKQKVTVPTTDENLAFLGLWAASLGAAIVGALLVSTILSGFGVPLEPGVMLVVFVFLYGGGLAASIGGIVSTRRIAWVFLKLGFLARRALPRKAGEGVLPGVPGSRRLRRAGT